MTDKSEAATDRRIEQVSGYKVDEDGLIHIPLNPSYETALEQYQTDPFVHEAVELLARENDTNPKGVIGRKSGFDLVIEKERLGLI